MREERRDGRSSPEWTPYGDADGGRGEASSSRHSPSHRRRLSRPLPAPTISNPQHPSSSTPSLIMPLRNRRPLNSQSHAAEPMPLPTAASRGLSVDSDLLLDDAEKGEGDGWLSMSATRDIVLVALVGGVGLILAMRFRDRDELVRVAAAMAAYGAAAAISMGILHLIAKTAWPWARRTMKDGAGGERAEGARANSPGLPSPRPLLQQVEGESAGGDGLEGGRGRGAGLTAECVRARTSSAESSTTTGVKREEEDDDEEDDEFTDGESDVEEQRTLMAPDDVKKLQDALSQAQVEVTTLQLKVNYYDSELHRQKQQSSRDRDELLRQQRMDLSKVFQLMVKHSPTHVRDALEPSDQPLALVSSQPPFIILHVNRAWSDTFHWDSHEIIGCDMNFFRGMIVDGWAWERLFETLALYGYGTADVLNAGSEGGYFLHSMTITPLVEPEPHATSGDVHLAGHVVRSTVRRLASLPPDQQQRFESYMEEEHTQEMGASPARLRSSSPPHLNLRPTGQPQPRLVRRRPLASCRDLKLMELLRYLGLSEEPLALLDDNGRVLHVNAAFSQLTAVTLRSGESQTLEQLLGGPSGWEERMRSLASMNSGTQTTEEIDLGPNWAGGSRALVSFAALSAHSRGLIAKIEEVPGPVVTTKKP